MQHNGGIPLIMSVQKELFCACQAKQAFNFHPVKLFGRVLPRKTNKTPQNVTLFCNEKKTDLKTEEAVTQVCNVPSFIPGCGCCRSLTWERWHCLFYKAHWAAPGGAAPVALCSTAVWGTWQLGSRVGRAAKG